ncbi:HD domain-containing protein [Clostridium paraputrificum]|uniref:HD domain-containing protein n=1 Tax=Clostridium TaxID=1485 RepID=UPI003D32CE15
MKNKSLKDYNWGEKIELSLMINKILDKNEKMVWAYVGDKGKEVKCIINDGDKELKVGDVLKFKGHYSEPFKPSSCERMKEYNIEDYLPTVKRPIEEIMKEIEGISIEEFKSEEAKKLNDYFFMDKNFLEKFKRAIGGVYNHHNYLGGLAEHTLGVMSLSKIFAIQYNCEYRELAVLGAKLHDIGKIYEMSYDGPFHYSIKGSLEGHIVMGITMLERVFIENPNDFSEDFKERIKGIIVQHHGKLEFGSPVPPRTQEAYIVHYADYVDASFNKIDLIKEGVGKGEWSKFDKRIEGRILF